MEIQIDPHTLSGKLGFVLLIMYKSMCMFVHDRRAYGES